MSEQTHTDKLVYKIVIDDSELDAIEAKAEAAASRGIAKAVKDEPAPTPNKYVKRDYSGTPPRDTTSRYKPWSADPITGNNGLVNALRLNTGAVKAMKASVAQLTAAVKGMPKGRVTGATPGARARTSAGTPATPSPGAAAAKTIPRHTPARAARALRIRRTRRQRGRALRRKAAQAAAKPLKLPKIPKPPRLPTGPRGGIHQILRAAGISPNGVGGQLATQLVGRFGGSAAAGTATTAASGGAGATVAASGGIGAIAASAGPIALAVGAVVLAVRNWGRAIGEAIDGVKSFAATFTTGNVTYLMHGYVSTIQGGVRALLGPIFGDIASKFVGVAHQFIDAMDDMIKSLGKFSPIVSAQARQFEVKTMFFQRQLAEVFRPAMSAWLELKSSLIDMASAIAPLLTPIVQALAQDIKILTFVLRQGVGLLAQTIGWTIKIFSPFNSAVGQLADSLIDAGDKIKKGGNALAAASEENARRILGSFVIPGQPVWKGAQPPPVGGGVIPPPGAKIPRGGPGAGRRAPAPGVQGAEGDTGSAGSAGASDGAIGSTGSVGYEGGVTSASKGFTGPLGHFALPSLRGSASASNSEVEAQNARRDKLRSGSSAGGTAKAALSGGVLKAYMQDIKLMKDKAAQVRDEATGAGHAYRARQFIKALDKFSGDLGTGKYNSRDADAMETRLSHNLEKLQAEFPVPVDHSIPPAPVAAAPPGNGNNGAAPPPPVAVHGGGIAEVKKMIESRSKDGRSPGSAKAGRSPGGAKAGYGGATPSLWSGSNAGMGDDRRMLYESMLAAGKEIDREFSCFVHETWQAMSLGCANSISRFF